MKAAFYTLGCKVNQYETQAMTQLLEANGIEIVSADENADIYVINSCTVTAESDRKTRQAVRRFKNKHPESIVILTGCMPQAWQEECRALTQADIVLGNNSNSKILEHITEYIKNRERIFAVEEHKKGEPFCCDTITNFRERTRANVKIEDGCNRFCSYCIIPYARGRVRSKPLEVLKNEISALEKNGFKEIVLVGINLSAYGTDTGEFNIVDAVRLAASFEGIKRVRLGSLEPDHITDNIISGLSEIPEFCPQFHISLQSGCNKTLKKMNRHYTAEEYAELCKKLRSSFSDTTLTTDVMVGFPDETEEDFEKSLEFVKSIGFEKVHVFPYSRRPGTPAAAMKEQLTSAEKESRAAIMIKETDRIRAEFLKSNIGKIVEVLPEEYHGGFVKGYTANYTPVMIKDCKKPMNDMTKVKIVAVDGDCCVGEATDR